MAQWTEQFLLPAKEIEPRLHSLKSYDQERLQEIQEDLRKLLQVTGAPQAYYAKVQRLANLAGFIIAGDTGFERGIQKLYQGFHRLYTEAGGSQGAVHEEVPQEDKQDISTYVNTQKQVLLDFRELCRRASFDDTASISEIDVRLQQWVKDFESRDLSSLATTVFAVENELIHNGDFRMETLQKLCALLEEKFDALARGEKTDVTDEENGTLFAEAEHIDQDPPEKEEVSDENCDIVQIPQDNSDLLDQFVQMQRDVLENFDSLIYDYETDKDKIDALKGVIHTWKGEFGVLGLEYFSRILHRVEDTIEACGNTIDPELFYLLRDFISTVNKKISENTGTITVDRDSYEKILVMADFHLSEAPAVTDSDSTESADQSSSATYELSGDMDLIMGFIEESREHLEVAEGVLLELTPETAENSSEQIDSVFRCYHTIKGVAGFLYFSPVEELAHALEDLMSGVRDNKIVCDEEFTDTLLEGNKLLQDVITNISTSLDAGAYILPSWYDSFMNKITDYFKSTDKSQTKPYDTPAVEVSDAQPETNAADRNSDSVVEEKTPVAAVEKPPIQNPSPPETAEKKVSLGGGFRAARTTPSETIRVPVDRLDALIASIGEAVIAQSMVIADDTVTAINNQILSRKITRADQIMRQVQELSMSLRMVSIKPTFQKMSRLVRELSKKFGKPVDFVMEGEDTEIDKSLVESIGDPLIHMVRNSVDHGIEDRPEQRRAAGKPERGKVILRAFHKSGSIFIEIEDDGKGLDRDAIFKKAVKTGLCRENDTLTEKECFQMIFAPGFSTSAEVTDVSGRGVGMDVVQRNIRKLRGAITINSEKNRGTVFSIRLPLTLAIIDGMIVRVENERFIIPKLSIVETYRPGVNDIKGVSGHHGEMVFFRDEHLVFASLAQIFDVPEHTQNRTDQVIIIVEDLNGDRLAVSVDEIVGQQQVVIKNIKGVGSIPGVTGGAIMSNGAVNFILDISAVISMAKSRKTM
jgi:two-component system chemotaxis sensor kinase CheA